MKPENVVEHKHFFAHGQDSDDEGSRVDACRLADGTCLVWDVDGDVVVATCETFDEACEIALVYAN